jgi:iron complex outermembrane recepter protein
MSAQRPARSSRSLLLISTLFLSAAFVLPAMAQVEEVTVTAERKTEDIQTVPIQISAFSAQDMQAHQIDMAKDLQFATPNVSYTRTNFSGDDFSIRGIGNDVISGGGESGVAVSVDNIYLAGATLDLTSFYDLDRVEVLEGPQSTLYGRGATAGTVNIVEAKPDLEQAFVNAEASYGNYDGNEDKVTINLPIITDELGVRISADRNFHDGFVTDTLNNSKIDGDNDYSVRFKARWQPTDATTIDFGAEAFSKDDTTMRSQRQECLFDPSGTLGCLPGGLANQAINPNAFFASDIASAQGFGLLGALGLPFSPALGLADLTQCPGNTPPPCMATQNPNAAWNVATDFRPTWKAQSQDLSLNVKQRVTGWLDFTGDFGFSHGSTISQESYNNSTPQEINPATLLTSEETFLGTIEAIGGPAYESIYASLLPLSGPHAGMLPVSGIGGQGIGTNNIAYYTNSFSTFDQSNAESTQWSADLRFQSHLSGPFNFLLGAYYLRQDSGPGDYYVSSGAQTYASLVLGGILGPLPSGLPPPYPPTAAGLIGLLEPSLSACQTTGCFAGSPYYDNSAPTDSVTLKSEALYGEVYYDIVPDLLKLTLGTRWTQDYKSEEDRITLFNSVVPFGTSSGDELGVPYLGLEQKWSKWTGRAVLDYTPTLSFTDQTLIYASYSRGYKAGGFNPGLPTFAVASGEVSDTYAPEGIDAFEVGTKNMLLHDTLQANFDVWFYNYEGLQISQILDNDSINANVNSRMYGSEGKLIYAPDDHWLLNFNVGYTHSAIGNSYLVDPRNPTAGAANAILIKDDTPSATAAQNCALYWIGPGSPVAPADNPGFGLSNPYAAPPGGSSVLASSGIPLTNFGSCSATILNSLGLSASPNNFVDTPALNALGYSFNQPGGKGTAGGVPVSLHGNENPNTPPWTLSFGAQYTFDLPNSYSLVPRFDVYYQAQMWGREFEDPADRISAYVYVNGQVQFNAPDNAWYVQAFIKNMFNKTYVTGEYLTSSSSGLFTNEFLGDPRTYGVRVGVHF